MKIPVKLSNETVTVSVRKHARSKRISMSIRQDGKIVVTMPRFLPKIMAKKFVMSNTKWIEKNWKARPQQNPNKTKMDPLTKVNARNFIRDRIAHYNSYYNFHYTRITIRDQKTRWGSCSSNGTLSFNFRLALIPPKLADYVIVHELCHLKEMNHSSKFWNLVARQIPDYPLLRKELRKYEKELF